MSDRNIHRQEEYARQSFSFRTMKRWQLWSITCASVLVVAALLAYGWA